MRTQLETDCESSRWPHRVALMLVCATFPLIWVGGLVTTYDAGMAVPDWPSTYGSNLFLYPLATWWAGPWDLFIEHGHRLLAATVGVVTIAWLIIVWRMDARRWFLRYTILCLGLVIVQGLLGGARVVLDETLLARIHGCVGPVFFAACVAGAVFTSGWWSEGALGGLTLDVRTQLSACARLGWLTTGLAYLQLILGAHLRHVSPNWSPMVFRVLVFGHLIGAVALLAHAWILRIRVSRISVLERMRPGIISAWLLKTLVFLQIVLGTFVWRVKYQWPTWIPQPSWFRDHTVSAEGMLQVLTVTAHVAIGSLILVIALTVALRMQRLLGNSSRRVPSSPSVDGRTREAMA